MRRSLAALVLAGVAGGCSVGSGKTPQVLLPSVGPGYSLSRASGPLSADALTHATALPPDDLRVHLRAVRLQRAAERVWTARDGGFVTDIVITVATVEQAAGLVQLSGRVLPGPATRAYTVPGVSGGRGFIQTSVVRGQTMFCVIAFFNVQASAFVVTRCSPTPQDTTEVSRLAAEQARRAS